MERLGVIQLNCTDQWEGLVECWRKYNGFSKFLLAVFSMAYGIKVDIAQLVFDKLKVLHW